MCILWESYYLELWQIFLQFNFVFAFIHIIVKVHNVKLYWDRNVSLEVGKNMKRHLQRNETYADIILSHINPDVGIQGINVFKILMENYFEHKILCVKAKQKYTKTQSLLPVSSFWTTFLKVESHKNTLKIRKYVG